MLQVRILELSTDEARELDARLREHPGVDDVLVDGPSELAVVHYRAPGTPAELLGVLRSTGHPVLSDFACC